MGGGGHVLDEMDAASEHVKGAAGASEIPRIVGRDGLRPENGHRIPGVGGDDVGPIGHARAREVEAAAVVRVVGVVAVLREGILIDRALPDLGPVPVEQAEVEDVDRVVADAAMDLYLVGSGWPRQAAKEQDRSTG